jgi:drug/metabolite transporter (DMT)-like permease
MKRPRVMVIAGILVAAAGSAWAVLRSDWQAAAVVLAGAALAVAGLVLARRNRRAATVLVEDVDDEDEWPEGTWPQIIVRRHGRPRRPAPIRKSTGTMLSAEAWAPPASAPISMTPPAPEHDATNNVIPLNALH